MNDEPIREIAALLHQRNAIDHRIASLINRPMTAGHLGEWIAARIFDIELEHSAVTAAIDGRFKSGPLAGRSVNVKWYLKREGLLDVSEADVLDYYLVMTGPKATAMSSRGGLRPWCIESVFLFDARRLIGELRERGVRRGVASSVRREQWMAAEIYPRGQNGLVTVSPDQTELLRFFAPRLDQG